MTTPVDLQVRAEHDAVLSRLSSRKSITHFAHAAVSFIVAGILGGVYGKLLWDLGDKHLELTTPVAVIAALIMIYSVTRYLLGRRALRTELTDYETLKSLRLTLRLDDPASWLPR